MYSFASCAVNCYRGHQVSEVVKFHHFTLGLLHFFEWEGMSS